MPSIWDVEDGAFFMHLPTLLRKFRADLSGQGPLIGLEDLREMVRADGLLREGMVQDQDQGTFVWALATTWAYRQYSGHFPEDYTDFGIAIAENATNVASFGDGSHLVNQCHGVARHFYGFRRHLSAAETLDLLDKFVGACFRGEHSDIEPCTFLWKACRRTTHGSR